MEPEIITGEGETEYNQRDAARSSFLWTLHDRSPAHALNGAEEHETTDALDFGTALHAYILHPAAKFEAMVAIQPETIARRAGKEWEAFREANAGKVILRPDDMAAIEHMTAVALVNERAAPLLDGDPATNEMAILWTDEETGVRCKCRLDSFAEGWVVDLKTTEDARPHGFRRSVIKYGYHFKGAFYLAGAAAAGLDPQGLAWVAMEKSRPYGVAVYTMTPGDDWHRAGEAIMRKALRAYAECRASNIWPSYTQASSASLELPYPPQEARDNG